MDLFPACGIVASLATLIAGLARPVGGAANAVLALAGLVPLVGWAIGITRLPPGSNAEVGLWLIALGSIAVLLGLMAELLYPRLTGYAA